MEVSPATSKKKPIKTYSANNTTIRLIRRIDKMISQEENARHPRPRILSSGGKSIRMPEPLFDLMKRVIDILIKGDAVSIVPVHKELTTQEAADLLNVSRPYLISLLEKKQIPFTKTGEHRRIKFSDLVEYKLKRDEDRAAKLTELTQMSEEFGLYK